MQELSVKDDPKDLAKKTYTESSKQLEKEQDPSNKKDHKNARHSHGYDTNNMGHKKLGLFGERASRPATKLALVQDALDLMSAEEEVRHASVGNY